MCHHFFPFSIHFHCICINILFTLAMFWLLNVLNPISKFSNGSTEMLFRSFTIHIILILKPMHKFTRYLSHAYTHSNLIYRTAWFWVSMFLYLTAYGFFFSSQNVVHFIYLYRFIHYSTESNKPKKKIFFTLREPQIFHWMIKKVIRILFLRERNTWMWFGSSIQYHIQANTIPNVLKCVSESLISKFSAWQHIEKLRIDSLYECDGLINFAIRSIQFGFVY